MNFILSDCICILTCFAVISLAQFSLGGHFFPTSWLGNECKTHSTVHQTQSKLSPKQADNIPEPSWVILECVPPRYKLHTPGYKLQAISCFLGHHAQTTRQEWRRKHVFKVLKQSPNGLFTPCTSCTNVEEC